MLIGYRHTALLTFSERVTEHAFSLRATPSEGGGQRVLSARTTVIPSCQLVESVDAFGSRVESGYIGARHDLFVYEATGVVETGLPRPPEIGSPLYVYPTALTAADEALRRTAELLPPSALGPEWIEGLMAVVGQGLRYEVGVTDCQTTASQAWSLGAGVCQDFAHVAIALCRRQGIPSRYVAGLMLGEGATHAWVEACVQGLWVGFDPTNGRLVDERYVKIAHGRDFDDCSLSRGTFRGGASQQTRVSVEVWEEQGLGIRD